MQSNKTALLLGLIFLALSCKKDSQEDFSAPTISGITINGKAESILAEAGDSITVAAIAKDDQSLGRLSIRVKGEGNAANWDESRSPEISGKEQNIEEVFQVPTNVKDGNYIVEFTLRDKNGNTADPNAVMFQVVNKLRPQLNITVPQAQAGDTLKLQGTVTDDSDLAMVTVSLKIPPGYSGDQTYHYEQIDITGSSDTIWDIQKDGQVKIFFPEFAKRGEYSLEIKAVDSESNINSFKAKVKL